MNFVRQDGTIILEVSDDVADLTFPCLETDTQCTNLHAGLLALPALRSLTYLVSRRQDPRELAALSGLTKLVELKVVWVPKGSNLEPLSTCTNLRVLRLVDVDGVDVTPLATLPRLEDLFLSGAARGLQSLETIGTLTRLGIEEAKNVSVRWFEANQGLVRLSLAGSTVRHFCTYPTLLDLDVRSTNLASIDDLGMQPLVESLRLDRCRRLTSLDRLERFHNLRHLSLGGLTKIKSLSPVGELGELVTLDLRGTRVEASEIRWLVSLPALCHVDADDGLARALQREAVAYPGWRATIGVQSAGFLESIGPIEVHSTKTDGVIAYRLDLDLTGWLPVRTNAEGEDLLRKTTQQAPLRSAIEFDSEAARFVARSTSLEAIRWLAHEINNLATDRETPAQVGNGRRLHASMRKTKSGKGT